MTFSANTTVTAPGHRRKITVLLWRAESRYLPAVFASTPTAFPQAPIMNFTMMNEETINGRVDIALSRGEITNLNLVSSPMDFIGVFVRSKEHARLWQLWVLAPSTTGIVFGAPRT